MAMVLGDWAEQTRDGLTWAGGNWRDVGGEDDVSVKTSPDVPGEHLAHRGEV